MAYHSREPVELGEVVCPAVRHDADEFLSRRREQRSAPGDRRAGLVATDGVREMPDDLGRYLRRHHEHIAPEHHAEAQAKELRDGDPHQASQDCARWAGRSWTEAP